MKKNLLWMFAAILFCGAMTTSCSKDEDKNEPKPTTSANTYEVTLAALLPRCSASYMQLKLDYTDADGKSTSVVIKEGDQSEAISDVAKDRYTSLTSTYRVSPEYIQLLDDLIVRNFTFKVPAGKSFEYKGTIVKRTDFTAPEGGVTLVQPCVISSAKRISGNDTDNSQLATNGSLSILASFNVKADRFATIVDHWNGRDAGSGTVTMK